MPSPSPPSPTRPATPARTTQTVPADDLVPVRWVEGGSALLLSPRQVEILAESTARSNVSHLRQRLHMNRILLALLWDRIARTSAPPKPQGAERPERADRHHLGGVSPHAPL